MSGNLGFSRRFFSLFILLVRRQLFWRVLRMQLTSCFRIFDTFIYHPALPFCHILSSPSSLWISFSVICFSDSQLIYIDSSVWSNRHVYPCHFSTTLLPATPPILSPPSAPIVPDSPPTPLTISTRSSNPVALRYYSTIPCVPCYPVLSSSLATCSLFHRILSHPFLFTASSSPVSSVSLCSLVLFLSSLCSYVCCHFPLVSHLLESAHFLAFILFFLFFFFDVLSLSCLSYSQSFFLSSLRTLCSVRLQSIGHSEFLGIDEGLIDSGVILSLVCEQGIDTNVMSRGNKLWWYTRRGIPEPGAFRHFESAFCNLPLG